MSSLLKDLRRSPTPLVLQSRGSLVSLVKEAETALAIAAIEGPRGERSSALAPSLRRYALWLEHSVFVEGNQDESVFEVASSLYEFAAELTDIPVSTIFRPPLNDFVRSALVASQSAFPGRASIVARRVADRLNQQRPPTEVDRCHLMSAQVVVSLLARRFYESFQFQRTLTAVANDAAAELRDRDALAHELDELDLAIRIANAAASAAAGMLAGVPHFIKATLDQLADLRNLADERNDAQRFWLSDRLHDTVQRMNQSSMHRLLGYPGSPIPPHYRHILAREGFLELWGTQVEALHRGIVAPSSSKNFVVSIPTGSGKTLIADWLILSTLGQHRGWGIYLAPSRALVNQVSQELRRRLQPCGIEIQSILAGAEQSFVLDEELQMLPKANSVVVTTPEKLDTYYRNSREIFDSCRLLIVDEAHKIAESQRGTLIESIVARFLVLQPDVRIALMSGVMSNAEELATWLDPANTESVVVRRRPTRHIYGVAVRQDHPVVYGKETQKKDKTTHSLKISRRVEFHGGIVLVREEDDLTGVLRVDLPNVFKGHLWERLRNGHWNIDKQDRGSPITAHAVGVAEAFARTPGTILVFLNNTNWVEKCAQEFLHVDPNFQRERRQLSDFLRIELGNEHSLPALCSRGVAFHHSRLPASVQRAVEMALERGWLKIVFATSTLREGINTPATTVIIAGLTYRDKVGETQISAMDFGNLAGRAGRPRVDTEGRIIVIPNSLAVSSAIEASREYILTGEAARKVRSQLRDLVESLVQSHGDLTEMPVNQQRILLSLKAADLDDAEGLSTFIDRTLWSFQEADEQNIARFVSLASQTFASAELQYGERLALASRVGLSLTSSELLRASVIRHQDVFEQSTTIEQDSRNLQIAILLDASLSLPEISGHISHSAKGTDLHLEPLLTWMSGARYEEVLEAGKASGIFKKTDKLNSAVKFCSDLSNWLSWSFGAAWAIIQSELEKPAPQVGVFPLSIRYGVPTITAAFISLLGVSDRVAAQILANMYDKTESAPTLQSVSDWMQNVDIDDLFPPNEHSMRAELLRRQAFRSRRRTLPYEFAGFYSDRSVRVGTLLTLNPVGTQIKVRINGETVGEVVRDDQADVTNLLSSTNQPPYVVTVAEASPNHPGAFVIIR